MVHTAVVHIVAGLAVVDSWDTDNLVVQQDAVSNLQPCWIVEYDSLSTLMDSNSYYHRRS